MYGRIFESMFQGSMVGSGAPVFAVWAYVIANMRRDSVVGAQVDLNPKLLAFILGEEEAVVISAIKELESEDLKSTSKVEKGKRLVRLGEFAYRVVNGAKYMEIRSAEDRREYNRLAKQKQREKSAVLSKGGKLKGEEAYQKAELQGDEKGMERALEESLPTGRGPRSPSRPETIGKPMESATQPASIPALGPGISRDQNAPYGTLPHTTASRPAPSANVAPGLSAPTPAGMISGKVSPEIARMIAAAHEDHAVSLTPILPPEAPPTGLAVPGHDVRADPSKVSPVAKPAPNSAPVEVNYQTGIPIVADV